MKPEPRPRVHRHPHHQQVVHVIKGEGGHSTHRPVTHIGHALSWMLDGTATVKLQRPVVASAGCFVVIPAGAPHQVASQPESHFIGAGFCAACLDLQEDVPLMAPFQRVRRGAPPVIAAPPDRAGWITSLFHQLDQQTQSAEPDAPEAQRAILTLLLSEARRAMGSFDLTLTAPTRISRALDFVWKHAFEPISLKDAARAVHCSPAHLAAEVKRETGYTIGDWLRSIRVSTATSWLLHSDAGVDEIARRVGWQDTTHFIRQFRKVHGATPAAWRRQMRQQADASAG